MSSVFISNVDDYLAPSQACVNPIFADGVNKNKTEEAKDVVVPRKRTVRRKRQALQVPDATPSSAVESETAKVSMADCLACSGCVTTAETVLVEQHSLTTLKEKLNETSGGKIVMTISPASFADLFRHLQIPNTELSITRRRIATMLYRQCRVSVVLDGRIPLSWSLHEAALEFCEAYRDSQTTKPAPSQPSDIPKPSVAVNCNEIKIMVDREKNQWETENLRDVSVPNASLPIYSSSCPALVCLIEKSHAKLVPHLSSIKSPMSMAGTWWNRLRDQEGETQKILHVCIMPCHDKKLEASRKDLFDQEPFSDLVITTAEWLELISEACVGSTDVPTIKSYLETVAPARVVHTLDDNVGDTTRVVLIEPRPISNNNDDDSTDMEVSGTHFVHGSGGYADYIFRYAAKQLFGFESPPVLPWTPVELAIRNKSSARAASRPNNQFSISLYRLSDGTYSLVDKSPSDTTTTERVLHFGLAHGQQTLQRILTTTPSSTISTPYDYVEAMACPMGACLNGGGQIRLTGRERPTETRQRVRATEQYYQVTTTAGGHATSSNKESFGPPIESRTRFHVVPPLQLNYGATAGVAVNDMQW